MIQRSKVTNVNNRNGTVELESHAQDKGKVKTDIPLTQPYAGRGWGIRAGVEVDTVVLVEKDQIVGYLPDSRFYRDGADDEQKELYKTDPQFKTLEEGEIALQSRANSLVFMNQKGHIALSTSDGSLFELNKSTDSINLMSVNETIRTEAAYIRNGIVKRDLRSDKQKEDDLFLSSLLVQNFSQDEYLDFVGADSQHRVSDVGGVSNTLYGIFDTAEGAASILKVPGIKDTPNADKITPNILNPALAEFRIDVNEFSDGISSLNIAEDREALKKGRLPPNFAGRFVLGTVVDENGRLPRFDYVFSAPKGHGDIWKLPKINDKQISTDFKVDLTSSIEDAPDLGDSTQWIASGIDHFNTAQMFQLVLNTRGADNKGNIPNSSNIGSRWALHVDKEGLTKWNIPAGTSLNGTEFFRQGRSLLWNLDGSITQSVGKEASRDLESITDISLLKTRQDRSATFDYEGSIETRVGKDSLGQSKIEKTDGGIRFSYGKLESPNAPFSKDIKLTGIQSTSKSGRLVGTSISGKTEGGVDLALGSDSSAQSISLAADGLIHIAAGSDSAKDSFKLDTTGNIKFNVSSGGHKFEMYSFDSPGVFKNGILLQHGGLTASVIQIDSNGVITLRNSAFNANIMISATGAISLINPAGKMTLGIDGSVSLGGPLAGIDISPTAGVIMRTVGGSISLNPAGKVEIAANLGCTITGPFSHLNTTGIALGAGAATSPYNVAASGPGFIDPLTGHATGGFPAIKA